uniref:Calponin-homology (CH) domain-containing protein n=1 Tax=Heterorhabditis bacteriophora TaxID=37862 RepID=A0A1I7W7K8_HETBA
MDAKKEAALLFWFNIYGTSLNLEDVPSTSRLWSIHIPSLLNCLNTSRNAVCVSKDATSTYCELFQYLSKSQDQSSFVSALDADGAASGDPLEIAKFLAVLLNEIRISKPYVISQSVAVMELEGHDTPLREISGSTQSLQVSEVGAISPAKYFPEESCFTGVSCKPFAYFLNTSSIINASSFVTPRGPSKRKENMYFTAPYSTVVGKEESPLMEIINSPKVRELRRDREIRSITKKLHDMEDIIAQKETELVEANRKVEALVEELTAKKVRLRDAEAAEKHAVQANDVMEKNITDLEKSITHLKRVVGEQKDRANNYKLDLEKSEEQRNDLISQIENSKDIAVKTKRELLDLKDELAARDRDVAFISSCLSKVQRELEEANLTVEENKQQYDAAISDIKARMEQKICIIFYFSFLR